jgi:hypothetical protein
MDQGQRNSGSPHGNQGKWPMKIRPKQQGSQGKCSFDLSLNHKETGRESKQFASRQLKSVVKEQNSSQFSLM